MKKFFREVIIILGLYKVALGKEEKLVKEVLENMDLTDPKKRTYNVWDRKFEELVPVLYKYDEAMEFLNTYGWVCETYFLHLSEEDVTNLAFQRKLCSVSKNSFDHQYYGDYYNLLFWFLKRWDFEETIKKELQQDPQKADIVRVYNFLAKGKKRAFL